MMRLRILLLVLAGACRGGDRAYWTAVGAHAGASAADYFSSLGKPERNPLLRNQNGMFSARKAAIVKAGSLGGLVVLEKFLHHRTVFTWLHFSVSGGYGVAVSWNFHK